MRRQELDGLVDGLFAGEAVIDLPERVYRALGHLAQMRVEFAVALDVAADPSSSGTEKDMERTLDRLRAITREAEHEMHAVVISCSLARRQSLASIAATKPTLL